MRAAIETIKADATVPVPHGTLDYVKDMLWSWILANGDQEVWTVKVWIIKKTFRIRDLHAVFAVLLGPQPAGLV